MIFGPLCYIDRSTLNSEEKNNNVSSPLYEYIEGRVLQSK